MADFSVRVVEITQPIEDHPDADRLSIVRIDGYLCISAKVETLTGALRHRYSVGDLVVYVPEGAVLPERILREGFWSEKDNKGILAGSKGNRVKAKRLRGIFSQGILLPVVMEEKEHDDSPPRGQIYGKENDVGLTVVHGDNVAEYLGIEKYEPPIPIALAGEVCSIFGFTTKYDFESIQTLTDLFTTGEEVVATEKIHGTNFQIGYVPELSHDELFGDGNIYIGSKGLSAKGLVMKNNVANVGNLYVRTLTELLGEGLGERLKELSAKYENQPVRLFGEIYGEGVQDLKYGVKGTAAAVFDIMIGNNYVDYETRLRIAEEIGVKSVPVLYEGPYDLDELIKFRDGKDTISNTNVREGIVIVARDGGKHPNHGRKIAKWVSPDYLERKGGTEFN